MFKSQYGFTVDTLNFIYAHTKITVFLKQYSGISQYTYVMISHAELHLDFTINVGITDVYMCVHVCARLRARK
jgi:hypothetical protein